MFSVKIGGFSSAKGWGSAATREFAMKVTFLGATHEVTGSCTLIECGNNRGLVDCGMEQGKDIFENQKLPVAAGRSTLSF